MADKINLYILTEADLQIASGSRLDILRVQDSCRINMHVTRVPL